MTIRVRPIQVGRRTLWSFEYAHRTLTSRKNGRSKRRSKASGSPTSMTIFTTGKGPSAGVELPEAMLFPPRRPTSTKVTGPGLRIGRAPAEQSRHNHFGPRCWQNTESLRSLRPRLAPRHGLNKPSTKIKGGCLPGWVVPKWLARLLPSAAGSWALTNLFQQSNYLKTTTSPADSTGPVTVEGMDPGTWCD